MADFAQLRSTMVDCQVRPSDVTHYPIIEAMLSVAKEEYVPANKRSVAYSGEHLEISPGRVVLDPRVMGKMLSAVNIQPDETVLDLGCGLGYSAALIAHLAAMVIAVEEDEAMVEDAERILSEQGVDNAVAIAGKLSEGAAKHGPFDVIIIEGGVETVPETILEQLKVGGRIATIVLDGSIGQCRVGRRDENGVNWRPAFDATAPKLRGFEKKSEFVF